MNGAGNDFVVLNNLEEHLNVEDLPQVARTLCERHLSIGADGLMVVDAPDQGGDYKMRFYNADGSMGEMCGNGARCICRYACTRSASTTPPLFGWTIPWKWTASGMPAPMWSWAIPAFRTRWFRITI